MKRAAVVVVTIVVVVLGVWWGYETFVVSEESATATEQDAGAESADELENVIWASGKLQPETWAGLSTANTGIISQILVEEGDWVQTGDLLLELDNDMLESEVAVAVADVTEAQAALEKLKVGATEAEIAAAEALLAAAEAQVALAAGQMLEAQAAIDSVESQVEIAKRQYAELASHPTAAEVTAAVADVAVAEAAVSQTQAAYNLVRGDPQIMARPESLALQQATASYEAAKAHADLIRQGATPEQLAVAESQITAAETQVNAAKSRAPGVEAGVQSAIAERDSAQAALDQLLVGATKEDIDIAEARMQSARSALGTTQALLQQSQIVAPFDGQVGTINVRVGELATPERFLLLLGDARKMYVETTDLRETDVVRLQLGMPVEVTFDALPERVFQSTITQIAPVSNTEKGSTNYTVKIDVDDLDEKLRWGMTAFVNIEAP